MKYSSFVMGAAFILSVITNFAAEIAQVTPTTLNQLQTDAKFIHLLKGRVAQFTNRLRIKMYKLDLSNLGLTDISSIADLQVPFKDDLGKYHEKFPLKYIKNVHLLLNNNSLKSLPSEIGTLGRNIMSLNLDNNDLETLPVEFLNLERVNFISLKNNPSSLQVPWTSIEELKSKLQRLMIFEYLPFKTAK